MRAWLKSLIQRGLKSRGLRVTYDRDDLWTPDFDLLGLIVDAEFAPARPRTLIQVGANDGVSHDPVEAMIRRDSLIAVRVEPLPEPFARLQAHHAGDPSVTTVQAAIDATDGTRTIWRVRAKDGPSSKLSSISSFDRRIVEKHYDRYRRHGGVVVEETVQALSPRSLLDNHFPKELGVDVLQVDTEGHDATIVCAFLDADITPRVVNFEHNNLTGEADRRCCSMLRSRGYRLARYGRDTVALLGST